MVRTPFHNNDGILKAPLRSLGESLARRQEILSECSGNPVGNLQAPVGNLLEKSWTSCQNAQAMLGKSLGTVWESPDKARNLCWNAHCIWVESLRSALSSLGEV